MLKTRPQRPSADATRRKIIQSALKLFMQHGFAGTAISDIANHAKVNQTLIFHHFGSKQHLWRQVKATIIESVKADEINLTPKNLTQFITEAIQQRINIYKQCPSLRRLVTWQKLESTKSNLIGIPSSPFSPLQWKHPIKYLQEKKMLDPHLKPEAVITLLISSIDGMISDDLVFFKDNPAGQKAYVEMLERIFIFGLR